jgi:hydroxymethylbilane synthase
MPAVGQGALAVQCRTGDSRVRQLLAPLDHRPTRIGVSAERAFLAMLEGGCSVPLAGFAELSGGSSLRLRGLIGSVDGKQVLRGERSGEAADVPGAEQIGRALAEELLSRGGGELLRANAQPDRIPDS